MRVAGIALLVCLAVALVWRPQPLASCGPFFETFVFTSEENLSLRDAVPGRWDVIQPTYRHVSLILAYRYLSGVRLTAEEVKALSPEAHVLTPEEFRDSWPPGVSQWLRARKQVPGAPAVDQVDPFRPAGQFQYFHNCLEDSFRTAARTLEARIQQFGPRSSAVADWLQAQDRVFQNCSGQRNVFPSAAPQELPPSIRADRAYQIAAAHFYAGDLEEAARLFGEISEDASSPWSSIAPYLVARCRIRQGTGVLGVAQPSALTQAENTLEGILADGNRHSLHEPARKLLGFVRVRLHPEEQRVALSRLLSAPGAPERLSETLTDYHYLLDRLPAAAGAGDDLTDWVLNFKAEGRSAFDHAYQRWRASSSLPWLVAAIAKAPARDPRAEELLTASAAVKPDSPAFASTAFHRVRLLEDSGRTGEARRALDALLAGRAAGFSASARNLLKAQRMKLAGSLEEFLRDAPREVVAKQVLEAGESYREGADPPILFDADAAAVLNERMPVSLLTRSASARALPVHLRRQVAQAAWVRAVLLEDDRAVQSLARTNMELAPDLRPQFETFLKAASPEERRFAAVYLLLQVPGLKPYLPAVMQRKTPADRIDEFRDNWWCSFGEMKPEPEVGWNYYRQCCTFSASLRSVYPDTDVASPAYLTESERISAASEWKKLRALPCAPDYLAAQATAYARRQPNDPRVPEALHLAVRATRLGCTDEQTGKYSQQAFALLHQRYPKSPWTARTPYWYR